MAFTLLFVGSAFVASMTAAVAASRRFGWLAGAGVFLLVFAVLASLLGLFLFKHIG